MKKRYSRIVRSSRKYRVGASAARIAAVMLMVVGLVSGCTGFADDARPDAAPAADGDDGFEVASELYDSMVRVFEEDTDGIDVASTERLLVISVFESVGEQRRRRFVGQVVPVGGGIGVQIIAEYQEDVSDAEEAAIWEDEPREAVEREASPQELRMARRVERVYHQGPEAISE